MKIAIIGHGRMGSLVEKIALERGHEISCIIDIDDTALYDSQEFRSSDVAIQFCTPATAVDSILRCFAAKVPVVCGTTGWKESQPEIIKMCEEGKGTLMFSSNFSIGMNLFMALNRFLGRMMDDFDEYSARMEEVHHIHKLDHPSGTAITLAEDLERVGSKIKGWFEPDEPGQSKGNGRCGEKDYKSEENRINEGLLPIYHRREGEVPGIHTITWESGVDSISITHSAKSREGFALGAVKAAEWLKGRRGYFTMADMLKEILEPTR